LALFLSSQEGQQVLLVIRHQNHQEGQRRLRSCSKELVEKETDVVSKKDGDSRSNHLDPCSLSALIKSIKPFR
jgi:hypothetical protein